MTLQEKSPDAFRTISEVAEDLDLPQHVLRFWETRFSQIKPLKRGGGRRYYRPDDVELLKGVRFLLYGEGYTIKGVQRILKEQGPRFVMQVRHQETDGPITLPQTDEVDESVASEPVEEIDSDPIVGVELDASTSESEEPQQATPTNQTGAFSILNRLRGDKSNSTPNEAGANVSKENMRLLQSTLFELLECKRTLDQAR